MLKISQFTKVMIILLVVGLAAYYFYAGPLGFWHLLEGILCDLILGHKTRFCYKLF